MICIVECLLLEKLCVGGNTPERFRFHLLFSICSLVSSTKQNKNANGRLNISYACHTKTNIMLFLNSIKRNQAINVKGTKILKKERTRKNNLEREREKDSFEKERTREIRKSTLTE